MEHGVPRVACWHPCVQKVKSVVSVLVGTDVLPQGHGVEQHQLELGSSTLVSVDWTVGFRVVAAAARTLATTNND